MNHHATITIKDSKSMVILPLPSKMLILRPRLTLIKQDNHFGTLSHFVGPFSADQLAMLEDMLDNLKSEIRIIEDNMLDLNARTSKHIKRLEGYR